MPRTLALLLPLALAAAAGACSKRPTADGLMNRTTIGQSRCSEVKAPMDPFVVEWDATSTAIFESLAQRDVVFVRYENCELEVLTACSDDGMSGRYGAYNAPMWTTGGLEGFDIRDEYELYAKLPLGAASFAAEVAGGATLRLQYRVSGVVTATRNNISKGDLGANPGCGSATHFVQAYSLGAFELLATQGNRQKAKGGTKGIGAGGGHERSESRERQGGDLGSCTADGARELSSCKLPIRLVLRPLAEGGPAAAAAATTTPTTMTNNMPGPGAAKAVQVLTESALKKMAAGDGPGCLVDLDRAKEIDAPNDRLRDSTRAICEMQAGRCEDGKKRYRRFMEQTATGVKYSAGELDATAQGLAVQYCKGKGGLAGPELAQKLSQSVEVSSREKNLAVCLRDGEELLPLVPKLKRRDKIEEGQQIAISGSLLTAARCADALGRCPEAKRLLRGYVENNPGLAKDAERTIAGISPNETPRCAK